MKKNHLRLVKHMATNIVLLLAAMVVLLIAAAHRNYTRQMERLDVYIGVLSGRTAQHAGDVFQDKLSAITSAACHGGSAVSARLLRACCAAGAAPAGPGEFTKRAFLSGRISLTQAEAVMDLINATSRQAAAAAAAPVEEKTEFDVVMTEFGAEKIKVIKEVRGLLGLGLAEAKALVEAVPAKLKEAVSKEEGEEIKSKLEAVGAKVELK